MGSPTLWSGALEGCPYGGQGRESERMARRFLAESRDDRVGGWGMGSRLRGNNGKAARE